MSERLAVLISRFQSSRLTGWDHSFLEFLRKNYKQTLVLLPTPPVKNTLDNPLDFPTRKGMLHGLDKGLFIVALSDTESDIEWSKKIDLAVEATFGAGSVVDIHCSKDACAPFYSGLHKVIEFLPQPSITINSVKAELGDVSGLIESHAWRAGMVYASTARFDMSYQRTDIVPYRIQNGHFELLLSRKVGSKEYYTFGGPVKPIDETVEEASLRELREKAGFAGWRENLGYVGSTRVVDWRYRFSRDKVMSSVFLLAYSPSHGRVFPVKGTEAPWLREDSIMELISQKSRNQLGLVLANLKNNPL